MNPASLLLLLIPILFAGVIYPAEVIPHSSFNAQKTGKVIGVVVDHLGAVIPDASVTIQNDEIMRKLVTDDDGEFKIELPEGVYRMTVEREDFCKYKQEGLEVQADQKEEIVIELIVKGSHVVCP